MDTIKIDTSQNIDIEQPIASIGERIAATLYDSLFIFGYAIVIISIYGGSQSKSLLAVLSVPIALYSIISELVMSGQSWGKKIMKIKVVKTDGTPTTFSSYFLRWILRLVEIVLMIGSLATIIIILNRKGQRLGDIAANTSVIRLQNKSLKDSIYIKIPENYTVVYPETIKLTINDIYTIKEVLDMMRSTRQNRQTLTIAEKAHEAIERKLGVKTNQKTESFFRSILLDYNFINSK